MCGAGDTAMASSIGTISTNFTWKSAAGKTLAQGPPPKKVAVLESASALWSWGDAPEYPSGLQSSGNPQPPPSIADIPDNQSPTQSLQQGGRRGSRVKVYDVGTDGILKIECSLSAKVTVTAGSTTGGMYGASVTYSASISDIRIVRTIGSTAAVITDDNDRCLPGEAMNLSVVGADVASPHSWSITGDIFKNFDHTKLKTATNNEQFEGEGAVIKTDPTISYRYIKGDESVSAKKVSVTVKVDGVSVDVEDELKVGQPIPHWKFEQGSVQSVLINGIPAIQLAGSGIAERGVDWQGTYVELPPAFGSSGGAFGFCQLVIPQRYFDSSDGTKSRFNGNGLQGLDGQFPYGGVTAPTGSVSSIDAGDSPLMSIGSTTSRLIIGGYVVAGSPPTGSEKYEVWLMFKSNEPASCWVPLRKAIWNWKGVLKPSNQNWVVEFESGPNKQGPNPNDTFPEWERINNKTAGYTTF